MTIFGRLQWAVLLCGLCSVYIGTSIVWAASEPVTITLGIKDKEFQRSDPKNPSWKGISHSDAYQGSYYHNSASNSPDLYGTWTPAITIPGRYNVYMHWVAHPNRSAAALVRIKHASGVYETTVDQQVNGKTWNLLGQFEFNAGEESYVRLHSTTGYTVYDGVRFELVGEPAPPEGVDLGIDNPNFSVVGDWKPVQESGSKYVELPHPSSGNAATWGIPDDLRAGEYEVYVRYPAAAQRPASVIVHVKFDLGLDTAPVINQTQGTWANIGRYSFTPGYGQYVKLLSAGEGNLAAETIRFVLVKEYTAGVTRRPPALQQRILDVPRYSGAIPVAIVKDQQGKYGLTRGGVPYFIKGVCGSENLSAIATSGANALRTYSHKALNGYQVLDEAYEKGIGVWIGLWMTQQDSGIDYSNPFYRDRIAAQQDELMGVVMRYKDHPAVIGWALGNEQDKGNADVWYHVNELAQLIHTVDPNHPTMAVLAGAHPSRVEYIRTRAPYIDIIGVNSYIHIADVYNNVVKLGGWQGPYMLTEWGPDAAYEVAKVNSVAPIEQASSDKALLYYQRYQNYIASAEVADHLVGSFVFKLADVFGTTHTWYNILLETNKKTPLLDEMVRAWTGVYPGNLAPRVSQLALSSGKYQSLVLDPENDATVILAKGERFRLRAVVADRENDTLEYRWEIRSEYKAGGPTPPPVIPGVLMEPDGSDPASMFFYAPNIPGDYRVYLYVYDGNQNVGTHNYPFRVE